MSAFFVLIGAFLIGGGADISSRTPTEVICIYSGYILTVIGAILGAKQ